MYRRLVLTIALVSITTAARADSIDFDLSAYQAQPGLTATVADETLTITWEGDQNNEVRIRFVIDQGTPTLRELAIRPAGGSWRVLATGLTPEFRVVSGLRRVTQQQTEPLVELGVPLTAEKLDEIKWEAFWDAPLYIADEPPRSHQSSIPAAEPFANHPGMPRQPEEVRRATASYRATGCAVRANGARLEITFPGVEAGLFAGYLQYDVFKGSNLVRQMLVAQTDQPSVAFKYDAGFSGLPIQSASRMVWRDLVHHWQDYRFGGPVNDTSVIVRSSNRLIAAELPGGALAAFPRRTASTGRANPNRT